MAFATIAAISGFVAAAIESTSSGADPVASATIESYASITELHKRIGNIEDMLLDIHKTLGIQPGQLDQALAVRSALDSEIRVWASLQEQRSDRNGMLAQLRAGKSKDDVWMDYVLVSEQNAKELSVNTFNLIETGPFSMEIALVGISAEAGILAEAGAEPEVIVSRIADKLERVEEKLDLHVGPLVLDASERLEKARLAIDAYVAGNEWMTGGEFLSAKYSIVYYGTGHLFAACYSISASDGSVPNGTMRHELLDGDAPRYDISPNGEEAGNPMCGKRSEFDAASSGNFGNRLRDYGFKIIPKYAWEQWVHVNEFREWRRGLTLLLTDYNLKADYLDILIGYDSTIRYGVDTLNLHAQEIARGGVNAEMASLGAALDAVHAEYTGQGVWQILEAERRIETSRAEAFRQKFSDVAAGIDAGVDAGLRRHAAVIAAYEKDQETLAIAGYFKVLATLAGAIDTLQEISGPEQLDDPASSSKTKTGGAEVAEAAQETVELPDAAEASGVGVAPGVARDLAGEVDPIAGQPDNVETRAKRLDAIITELKLLGPPTGNPENTGITRQEKLIFEASALLDLWEMTEADKAYLANSSDALEDAAGIAMKLGAGDLRAALIDIVVGTFKPTMIADMSPWSITEKKRFAERLDPHVDAMVRWRIPRAPSAQEIINNMILNSQFYPKMEAR